MPSRIIRIVDYDPAWPEIFRQEAERVRSALGERVLRLEHVGSTSVPGLGAKPIVDMLLEIADSADEVRYVAPLEPAGYELHIREPEWHEHRMFKDRAGRIHLHVFSAGCPEIARMVRFRDWLREHPEDRAVYESTKRELAQQEWSSGQDYADAKTTVVEEILKRAASACRRG